MPLAVMDRLSGLFQFTIEICLGAFMYLVHSLELDRLATGPVPLQDYTARSEASCWIRTSVPAVRAVKERT
jgi:hypothetical protein